MSLKIEPVSLEDRAEAIAIIAEDLAAATRNKLPENSEARLVLARWIRDKKDQLEKLLKLGYTSELADAVNRRISWLRAERAASMRVMRQRREQIEEERRMVEEMLAA